MHAERTDYKEAQQALEREKQAQRQTLEKGRALDAKSVYVEKLGRDLQRHRNRNHFAELIRRSLS